jgi:hypothetical protein
MSHKHGTGRYYKAGCESCQALKRDWQHAYMDGNEEQKEKTRVRLRKYRRWERPDVNEFVRQYNRHRYAHRREEIDAYKLELGCGDCGLQPEIPQVLDFDHVRGEKSGDVSQMLKGNYEKLWAEIEKCDVVCANCHRIRTMRRKKVAV